MRARLGSRPPGRAVWGPPLHPSFPRGLPPPTVRSILARSAELQTTPARQRDEREVAASPGMWGDTAGGQGPGGRP